MRAKQQHEVSRKRLKRVDPFRMRDEIPQKKQNNQKGTNIIKVQQTTAIKLTVKM